jgi:hypothetical protein
MIVVKPFAGESIPVSEEECTSINEIFDASASKWTKPDYVVGLFAAANSGNSKWVYLKSESWHQPERADGGIYKHVTVRCDNWTYHCYTTVKSFGEEPKPGTHSIDCISYQNGSRSIYLYPG